MKEFDAKRDAIVRLGKQLEDSSTHTFRSFVFPCFSRSVRSSPASTFHGHTRGRNIIIEGMGTLLEFAHEVGHALELEHNKRSDGLMLRQPTGIFLTRQDILKIGMLR